MGGWAYGCKASIARRTSRDWPQNVHEVAAHGVGVPRWHQCCPGHRPISNGLQLAVARRGAVQVNAAPCILTASEDRLQANQREIAS